MNLPCCVSPANRPFVVSVVSHGQWALLQALLESLDRCQPGRIDRLVLTINVPEPIDEQRLACLPFAVTVVRNPRPLGFGANHNRAFGHAGLDRAGTDADADADASHFAVVNPDIRFENCPFDALAEALARHERLGVAAPRIVGPDGRLENAARRLYTPGSILAERRARYVMPRRPAWLAGMFLAFRARAFEAVAGFDERYFLYGEDFDICARLRLAGWELGHIPHPDVVHDARRDSHRSARHLLWHLASMARIWTGRPFWRYRALLAREHLPKPAEPSA